MGEEAGRERERQAEGERDSMQVDDVGDGDELRSDGGSGGGEMGGFTGREVVVEVLRNRRGTGRRWCIFSPWA